MTLPKFEREFHTNGSICTACGSIEVSTDKATGLCRPCWRAAVLTPAALKGDTDGR